MKRIAAVLALLLVSVIPMLAAPHPAFSATAAAAGSSGSSVTLTWTASTTPGGTVNIYRCVGANCTNFTQLTTGVVAAGPYTDSTVTAGLYSYYGILVVNGSEAIPSNIASVTVRPQPITGLAGTTP